MANTHTVVPIPAYSADGNPIRPEDYERRLRGAVVEVQFVIYSYFIKRDRRTTFSAVVRDIEVLRPPNKLVKSPMKKRRPNFNGEYDESPTKKSRTW